MKNKQNDYVESDFPIKLGQPARQALIVAGYTQLEQLTKINEAELLNLHGMGPKGIRQLREALDAKGLSFAEDPREPKGQITTIENNNTQAYQQSPMPNPDLKSLDRLVGSWNVVDPSRAEGVHGKVTYEWMEGGFFLLQHVNLEHDGQPIKGIEIIGHLQQFGAEPSEEIKSRYYGTTGDTLDYVYELEGDALTIWGGEKGSPAYYKGKFSDDGNTATGEWVYPGGGGYQSSMTRITS